VEESSGGALTAAALPCGSCGTDRNAIAAFAEKRPPSYENR
jgi:hypothetical protein